VAEGFGVQLALLDIGVCVAGEGCAGVRKHMWAASRVGSYRFQVRFFRAVVAFLLFSFLAYGQPPTPKRGMKPIETRSALVASGGPYYAIVIGNNVYRSLPRLQTAVHDATEVAKLLELHYGFQPPKLLLNATRSDILLAFNEYRRKLPPNSSLVIYYAGHGHKDPDTKKAYWLPVDAQSDSDVNWISASTITEEIGAIHSSHVLVISDSCYSGELVRGAQIALNPTDRNAYLERMLESPSRTLMASGRDEPVADGGTDGHSKFAYVLLESLRRIDEDRFTANDLFLNYIQPAVAGGSDQVPQYNVIQNSGHAFGDFVFSRLHGPAPPLQPPVVIPAGEVVRLPVRPPANPDSDAVVATLHRYEDAYGSMDISMLKSIWPSLSKTQVDKLKAGFKGAQAVKVQLLQCDTAAKTGESVQIRCDQSMAYTRDGRRQPVDTRPVEITLRKSTEGSWLVNDVRFR
jgi:caspase domain-containing protein